MMNDDELIEQARVDMLDETKDEPDWPTEQDRYDPDPTDLMQDIMRDLTGYPHPPDPAILEMLVGPASQAERDQLGEIAQGMLDSYAGALDEAVRDIYYLLAVIRGSVKMTGDEIAQRYGVMNDEQR